MGSDGFSPSDAGYYWFYRENEGNGSLIEQYGDEEYPYASFNESNNQRPDYMTDPSRNHGVLHVSTAMSPLEYAFNPIDSNDGPTRDNCIRCPADDSGLYIDLLANFQTAIETPDAAQLKADGYKLCFGVEADAKGKMRLVVVAGSLLPDGTVVATNYLTTALVQTGIWYRVTGRLFAQASTKAGVSLPAYALYVDGQPVTCDESTYAASGAAAQFFGGNEFFEKRALFPSLQPIGTDHYADCAYSLAFRGSGDIDEIGITRDNIFAKSAEVIDFVLICDDTQLASLEFTGTLSDGTVYTNAAMTANFNGLKLPVYPGSTLTFNPVAKPTIGLGEDLVLGGNKAAVSTAKGYSVTFVGGAKFADSGRVTAILPTAKGYFEFNGVSYTTFNAAVNAATNGTVTLIDNIVMDDAYRADNGRAWVRANQNIVLDLHGKTIKGTNIDKEATIYNQGILTIVDYSETGGGVIEAPGTVVETDWADISTNTAVDVNRRVAALTIGATDSQLFTVKGRVKCSNGTLVIRTGEYMTPTNEPHASTQFYLNEFVDTDGRFSVNPTPEKRDGLWFWQVLWNSKAVVTFETPHGSVTPDSVLARVDTTVEPPVLDAPGYTLSAWLKDDGTPFDFSETISGNLHLTAELATVSYAITHTPWTEGVPSVYNVERVPVKLPAPTRAHYQFMGWKDAVTGHYVDTVGEGATFVDVPDMVVTGNLELVAQWQTTPIKWENTTRNFAESNGVYSGSWTLTLPSDAELTAGRKVKINEIAFCIVNPTQYPQVAPVLLVTPEGAASAVSSDVRADHAVSEGQYVDYELLANGRAKVSYRFTEHPLTLAVGAANEVRFGTSGGVACEGFLRLAHTRSATGLIFSNCTAEQAADPAYAEYGPLYEVTGEVVDE